MKTCEKCGAVLKHYDRVTRIVKGKGGRKSYIHIERFRCPQCKTIHRVLPDCVHPYKQYLIEDMSVEEDCIKFSWLLSRNVTKSKGTVSYIVCGKKSSNGDIIAEWNTRVSNGTVSEGLETSASIETENADVIEQILLKIGSVSSDEPNKQENQVLTAKSDGTTSYEYPACMPISKKKRIYKNIFCRY